MPTHAEVIEGLVAQVDALRADLDALGSVLDVLAADYLAIEQERDRYRAALRHYADAGTWIEQRGGPWGGTWRGYDVARQALAPAEEAT